MTVTVWNSSDDYAKAVAIANEARALGKRYGVMRTVEWNQMHPNKLSKTANRWTVFEERR